MAILEIKNLKAGYQDRTVLKDLNLSVEKAEIFGLIGPNGAGKSTLLKSILCLRKPYSGEILYNGEPINDAIVAEHFGASIEEPAFYSYLSAFDNLKIHQRLASLPETRINDALDFAGLSDVADRKVSGFSYGMKQRLALARAFISDPEIILLDEPTNGLDPVAVLELRDKIAELNKHGTTIIFCSHQLYEVHNICSRIGFLKDGKIKILDQAEFDQDALSKMEQLFL